MKLLQQTPQQQGPGAGSSSWSGAPSSGLGKSGKPPALALLEMQQEAERLLKVQQQQRAQQQRDRVRIINLSSMFFKVWEYKQEMFFCYNDQPDLSLFPALRHVDGEFLHGRAVGGRCWHVGRIWRDGG